MNTDQAQQEPEHPIYIQRIIEAFDATLIEHIKTCIGCFSWNGRDIKCIERRDIETLLEKWEKRLEALT